MKRIALYLWLVCATVAAPQNGFKDDDFVTGNRKFAADIYREIIKQQSGNLIFSPLVMETIMSLTVEGGKGKTRDEVIKALHLPNNTETIHNAFKELLPKLSSDSLKSANQLFVDNTLKTENTFLDTAEDVYLSGVELLDFSNQFAAADIINKWVEDNTNNKIHDLISPSDIQDQNTVVVVNALYMNCNFSDPFAIVDTITDKFYTTPNETVDVDMMRHWGYYNIYFDEELDAYFVQKPYDNPNNLILTIVVPKEKDGLNKLEINANKIYKTISNYYYDLIEFHLPKFLVNTFVDFKPVFANLGVKTIFDYDNADLRGIADIYPLYVHSVVQKAFIDVTETGTESSAAGGDTPVGPIPAPPPPEPIPIFADHPFVYWIEMDGIILFEGRIVNPAQ